MESRIYGMEMEIQWNKPIPFKKVNKGALIYDIDLEKVPDQKGIYILARRYNRNYYALYIGESTVGTIRRRIRKHLNNLKLMRYLESAKRGRRVLITGIPFPKGGQNSKKIIKIIEKAFIRHFMSEGHDLINESGTIVRYHKINSKGRIPKKFIPSSIFLER